MKNPMKAVVAAMSAVFLLSACAADTQARLMDKFSIDVINGEYTLPGYLLGMDKSLVEHPSHLSGELRGLRGTYALSGYNLVGATWFKLSASGDGNWARTDTAAELAANGVAGVITGRTDMDLNGVTLDYEHRFLSPSGLLHPYVRVGAGVGEITVHFRGQFVGHETQSGFDFPVVNEAADSVKRTVPIVNVEAGLKVSITEHLNMLVGGYWNTGYGGMGGLGWNF